MGMNRVTKLLVTIACAGALILPLSACGGGSTGDAGGPDDGAATSEAAEDASQPVEDESEADDDSSGDFVVIAGTGRYAVGTDIPFGGYQISGEPASQPDGCTWSIEDADGVVAFENQGSYAFLTDIPEGSVFVTNGCPEWEQFE